jgi:hypothetical protein
MVDDFTNANAPRSVLSFSEESLSSGEELSANEMGLPDTVPDYKNPPIIPGTATSGDGYAYLLDGLDGGNFGL